MCQVVIDSKCLEVSPWSFLYDSGTLAKFEECHFFIFLAIILMLSSEMPPTQALVVLPSISTLGEQ